MDDAGGGQIAGVDGNFGAGISLRPPVPPEMAPSAGLVDGGGQIAGMAAVASVLLPPPDTAPSAGSDTGAAAGDAGLVDGGGQTAGMSPPAPPDIAPSSGSNPEDAGLDESASV